MAEAGALMYMEDDVEMATNLSMREQGGVMGKLFQAGKRMVTGESFFITFFTNEGHQRRDVGFAAPYPGHMIPVDLVDHGGELICQKGAFVCGARGIDVDVTFQKKLGAGFFGGEGLFYAVLRGPGAVWLQTLPFSRLADRVYAAAPQGGGDRTGEGSILGTVFDMIGGD